MEDINKVENETFLLRTFCKLIQKLKTDNAKVDFITPTFSGLETESISESASLSEFESGNSSNKNGLSLSELANSPSVKNEEGELIYCGSKAGGLH